MIRKGMRNKNVRICAKSGSTHKVQSFLCGVFGPSSYMQDREIDREIDMYRYIYREREKGRAFEPKREK